MKKSRNKLFIFALTTLLCFLSVGYYSCEKTGNPAYCDNRLCQNGGYCLKGQCMCPSGYEDSTCSTPIVAKYLGSWKMVQTVVGSDVHSDIGLDSVYTIYVKSTATPTTFFLYNFLGNYEYNKIVCSLNETNSFSFTIDTITNAAMRFANIHFWGGTGTLYYQNINQWGSNYHHDSAIYGSFTYKFINSLVLWQVDTINFVMTPL